MHSFAFLSLLAGSSAAWWAGKPTPSPPNHREPQPVHNAHHIFNVIHSSTRQWGSSLNHNGVSFFLATVPEGVLLHHGTYRAERVQGLEWLAFEPEHAVNFAWQACENDTAGFAEEMVGPARTPAGWRHTLDRDIGDQSMHVQGERQSIVGNPPERPKPGHPFCMEPGYFHTYATRRPLHLLYIDGQSAAKTNLGCLDSQDYILRHNGVDPEDPSDIPVFDDGRRAQDLCHLARKDYGGRVDGFLRMEHGFEIMLCDFSILDVVSILAVEDGDSANRFDPNDSFAGESQMVFISAVAARYDGIGEDRVKINYDDFVTAFAYPDIDLWIQGNELPRLNGTTDKTKGKLKEDAKRMVLEGRFPGEGPRGFSSPGKHHPPSIFQHRDEVDEMLPKPDDKGANGHKPKPPRHHKQKKKNSHRHGPHKEPFWKRILHRIFGKHPPPPPAPPPPPPHHFHPPHPNHRPPPSPNWQSITDEYITRYSKHLPYLTSGRFNTSQAISDQVARLYKTYMNRTQPHIREDEVSRCTLAYIPHVSHPDGACHKKKEKPGREHPHHKHRPRQTLAERAIVAVARDICETLWDVMDPNADTNSTAVVEKEKDINYDNKIASIEGLIRRLRWTSWKKCSPDCGLGEVCFTAIWPFGSQEDHDHPSCKNGTSIMDRAKSMGYWWDEGRRGPGGGKPGKPGKEDLEEEL